MGEVKKPCKVKLFFGILFTDDNTLDLVEKRLAHDYGEIDLQSPTLPFDKTTYYEKEMGSGIRRIYLSIKPLMEIEELPSVKLQTNALEKLFSADPKQREVNIDPGYLGLSKVVLATTKDYDHRLYIAKKIFAEVTLHYKAKEKSYIPWEWTYPDYREQGSLEFFNKVREIYQKQLKENP